MYTPKSASEIKNSILSGISDEYVKTEGNIAHDIPASVSIEIAELHDKLNNLYLKNDVDQLTGDELARFVKQRKGILKKLRTNAIGQVLVTGNGQININDLFETVDGIQYESVESKEIIDEDLVSVRCTIGGSIGVVGANAISLIPVTLNGIAAVTNPSATYDGFDDETDDSLRERYYEALRTPPTSGNRYHYLKWAKEVEGVGAAKVYPLWNGDNTVKVVIIDSDMKPTSAELVTTVQEYIDPESNGKGEGQAPIGAYCTVASADSVAIDIECDVIELEGYTLEQVRDNIAINLENYLKEIAFKQDYVSYAKSGTLVFDSQGVADYSSLVMNGGAVNISIPDGSVAVVGTITLT